MADAMDVDVPQGGRRSSRRSGNVRAAKRKEALALKASAGRDAILGQGTEDAVYDVVDEQEYARIRAQRQEEDDFIVDDAIRGSYSSADGDYLDDGGEIFDEEDMVVSNTKRSMASKVKRTGTTKRKIPKSKKRVSSLFTGAAGKSRLGNAVVKKDEDESTFGENDELLNSILQEEGVDADITAAPSKHVRKKKRNLRQLALTGSTKETQDAFLETSAKPKKRDTSPWKKASRAGSPGFIRSSETHKRTTEVARSLEEDSMPVDDYQFNDGNGDDGVAPMDTNVPSPSKKANQNLRVIDVREEDSDDDDDGRMDYLKPTAAVSDASDWRAIRKDAVAIAAEEPAAPAVKIDTSKLPLTTETDEEGNETSFLRMYWLDCFESDALGDTIFIFGKVFVEEAQQYASCAVAIKNNERNLFFLPRKYALDEFGQETDLPVSGETLYKEVSQILHKKGIREFKCKMVKRNYCFEKPGVPAATEYLKVKYSAAYPKVPTSLTGETFSQVFGASIGPLERFLMKRDLMGPSWVDIRNVTPPKKNNYSWCKFEMETDSPKNLINRRSEKFPPPPLVVLSLSMQTVLNRKTRAHEIVCISGLVHEKVNIDVATDNPEKDYAYFNAIRKLEEPFPFDFQQRLHQNGSNLIVQPNERALLSLVLAKIHRLDPDIICGHNLLGFDLGVLLHRMKTTNTAFWSKLGRLRRKSFPKLSSGQGGRASYVERTICSGRLLCDVKVSAREFIRQVSYGLTDLAREQLNVKRQDVDQNLVAGMFGNTEQLIRLTDAIARDAFLVMSLMFHLQVIPLSKQITNITGGLLARTFCSGRSERNEYLLCHVFHRRKFIVPDKEYGKAADKSKPAAANGDEEEGDPQASKKKSRRRKPAYAGGLVLEPKKGYYDKYILLLDFNSLYPSIIQEYNLCFTTVDRSNVTYTEEGQMNIPDVPEEDMEPGILPKVLKTLIETRKSVKNLIKAEKRKDVVNQMLLNQYDVRQLALKLTANSMYGCLGFGMSRFYAKPIAALITSKGREILQKTVDLAEETLSMSVIYGDTDSIMINTRSQDLTEVKRMGEQVKQEVNKLYKKLEIEIDGVFKTMLLLKKKKYAALAIVEKNGEVHTVRETKGLDMVRRDWCGLSHDVGYYILGQILGQTSREDLVENCHEYLQQVAEDVKGGRVAIDKYIIHKGLTKKPEDYPDGKAQAHVIVALKMKAAGKSVRPLDTIPYAICLDGTDKTATQRAYHPDEIRKGDLDIDTTYYLKNQIHPVVNRLLQPIEGTDSMMIAECLGLDPSGFKTQINRDDEEDERYALRTLLTDEERYRTAERLQVRCRTCQQESEFEGVFRKGDVLKCGLNCPNPNCIATFSAPYLCNLIDIQARKYITKYYDMNVICDESSCPRGSTATRQLSVREDDDHKKRSSCIEQNCSGEVHEVYSAKKLETQINYYRHLVDVPHALEKLEAELKESGESVLAGHKNTFFQVYDMVTKRLVERSAWQTVDLSKLFSVIG